MLRTAESAAMEDEEDLMQEARLLKKLRAKKITEAQFEARMASLQSGAILPPESCDL